MPNAKIEDKKFNLTPEEKLAVRSTWGKPTEVNVVNPHEKGGVGVRCLKCDILCGHVPYKYKVDKVFDRIYEQFKCSKCGLTVQTSRWNEY